MGSRHVKHLIVGYVHGQLRPALYARVINHVRVCAECRALLADEERLANDLRREMPFIGEARSAQLSKMWAGVWHEVGAAPKHPARGSFWVPGVSAALAVLLVLVIVLPLLALSGMRAEAAPLPALPAAYASPTPGADEATLRARAVEVHHVLPQATVAYVIEVGASPVPEPGQLPVSPAAPKTNVAY